MGTHQWHGAARRRACVTHVMLLQVEAEKREIDTEQHLKVMADKETVRTLLLYLFSCGSRC